MKKNNQYISFPAQEGDNTENRLVQASEPITDGLWLEFDDSFIQSLSGSKPRITYYQATTIYQPINY